MPLCITSDLLSGPIFQNISQLGGLDWARHSIATCILIKHLFVLPSFIQTMIFPQPNIDSDSPKVTNLEQRKIEFSGSRGEDNLNDHIQGHENHDLLETSLVH